MNIGLSAAALAAMGYFVYSSTSNSSVVLKGKTVLITGAGCVFTQRYRRRNFTIATRSRSWQNHSFKICEEGSDLVLWDLNAAGMKETQDSIRKVAPSVRILKDV